MNLSGNRSRQIVPLLILVLALCFVACRQTDPPPSHIATDREEIARQIQQVNDRELACWYPLCLDTVYGGYYSDFNYKWELQGRQNKMIVTQARHIWSVSNAILHHQESPLMFRAAAHGTAFLEHTMWDSVYGGFYDQVDRKGVPHPDSGMIIKRAYGNAFAIYGLAACYQATHDSAALHLAQRTFDWLEEHSHDPQYGGYFQSMSREGTPYKEGLLRTPPKDQNSMIHMLEAYTELYQVWPNQRVKLALESLLRIVRDTLTNDRGYLRLFFKKDWTPILRTDPDFPRGPFAENLDHISFGHDVETSYLMLEASHVLGIPHDTVTLQKAKKKVDYALANGYDTLRGGIFDGGREDPATGVVTIVLETKEWWEQVEALNSFLLMSRLFPNDERNYYDKFCRQWEYCKHYLIDTVNGGWYWGGLDKAPNNVHSPKGTIWKADYHTTRAMFNCLEGLKPASSDSSGQSSHH